jgi:putative phosphoesterase
MRLAIVSGIHGNLPALEGVLADLKGRAPDAVVNLGDCATAPLWPRETCDLLATLRWPTVRGNHDRWLGEPARVAGSRTIAFTHAALSASQRTQLTQLPAQWENGDVLAVHGRPGDDSAYLLEDAVEERLSLAPSAELTRRLGNTRAALVLCGHSHLQHVAQAGDALVVNPGAVGCPRYADNPEPTRHEAGSPHARYAVATRRAGRWSVECFALAYDFDAVAARARASGRPDWAAAFLR